MLVKHFLLKTQGSQIFIMSKKASNLAISTVAAGMCGSDGVLRGQFILPFPQCQLTLIMDNDVNNGKDNGSHGGQLSETRPLFFFTYIFSYPPLIEPITRKVRTSRRETKESQLKFTQV